MHHTRHTIHHIGTIIDRHRLTQCLAADGQAGDQGGNTDGDQNGSCVKIALQLHNDYSRGGTADNTADITHYIVAERADLIGAAEQPDGFLAAFLLMCRHGMERAGIGRGHRNTDHVKDNAKKNKGQQYHDGYNRAGTAQRRGGKKAQHGG